MLFNVKSYIYIYIYIYNLKWLVLVTFFLNQLQLIFFFFCTPLNGFKYCYLKLIILSDINHLFTHNLDGYKYCYFSTNDPQPPPCRSFKVKGISLPGKQFKEYSRDNYVFARIDMISQSMGSGLSDRPSNPVRAKVKCHLTSSDPVLKHYEFPLTANRWLRWVGEGFIPAEESAYSTALQADSGGGFKNIKDTMF